MSKTTGELLEQFRKLAANDQRELFGLLLREFTAVHVTGASARRKTITDVAGKYRPSANPGAASHEVAHAEAIAASKTVLLDT